MPSPPKLYPRADRIEMLILLMVHGSQSGCAGLLEGFALAIYVQGAQEEAIATR